MKVMELKTKKVVPESIKGFVWGMFISALIISFMLGTPLLISEFQDPKAIYIFKSSLGFTWTFFFINFIAMLFSRVTVEVAEEQQ